MAVRCPRSSILAINDFHFRPSKQRCMFEIEASCASKSRLHNCSYNSRPHGHLPVYVVGSCLGTRQSFIRHQYHEILSSFPPSFRCTDVHRRDAVVVLVHDGQELRLRLDDLITSRYQQQIVLPRDTQRRETQREGNYTRK